MANAAELVMLIKADASGMQSGLDDANAKVGGLGASMGKFGAMAAGGLAIGGAAVGAFAFKAIQAGSDIAESQNKVNVVFGESATAINEMAATAAAKLGMTKGEVLSAAGGVGNLLTAMGQSKDVAAQMSVDMVQLATDLGSFNNASSTEVLEAMTAAMAGETDGMKRYGVAINEATLKQAAMDAGLGSNVQALSASEKQMLSMKIMMEQTTSAQGDFANTSDGMANSGKIIKAQLGDLAGEIGGRLLPAIQPLVSAFAQWLPGALDTAMGAFDAIWTAIQPVIAIIIDLGATIAGWVTGAVAAFTSADGQSQSLRDTFMDVFARIREAVATAWAWIEDNVVPIIAQVVSTVVEKVSELRDQFDEHFGGIRGAVAAVVAWFEEHVAPTIGAVFGRVAEIVGGVVAFFQDNLPAIQLIVSGVFDVIVGVIQTAFAIIKGVVETGMAIIRGDWSGAWDAMKGLLSGAWDGIKKILSGFGPFIIGLGSILLDAAKGVGQKILDGIKAGVQAGTAVLKSWIMTALRALVPDGLEWLLPGGGGGGSAPAPAPPGRGNNPIGGSGSSLFSTDVNATFGPSSPGTQAAVAAATASGEAVAGGLREGLASIEQVILWLNDTIAKTIGQRDVESLVQVATAIGAIRDTVVGIIEATEAAFAFKLPATADEVRARFQGLIDGFRNVIMDFKGLSASADKSETSGAGLLSKWDIPNVGAMSGALKNIADVLVGLSGALEAADKVKAIGPDVLTRLGESVTALGVLARSVVKQFGADFGTEAASAAVGHVASALGSFASALKAVADLDLGGVVALNASKLRVAATAANVMLAELRTLAAEFIAMDKDARAAIVDGVAAYASLVGSAVDALGAAAGLDLSKVVTLNATMMQVAGTAASVLVAHVRTVAAAFIAMDGDVRDGIVAGVQAFSDLVSAAASILSAASGAAEGLAKATKIDADLLTEHLTHLRDVVVPAVVAATNLWTMAVDETKVLTERIGAFAALLSAAVGAHSLIPSGELAAKAKINAAELGEHLTHLRDVVLPVVIAIVDVWTETLDDTKVMTERVSAFAALLAAVVGTHTLIPTGELAARSKIDAHELGVHLIHLRDYVLPVVLSIVDVWGQGVEEAKAMTERVSAFAALMSAVVGAHSLIPTGELKAHAQINADALRDSLTHLRDTVLPVVVDLVKGWGVGTDEAKALSEHVGAFGSVIGGIVSLYGSIAGMSTDPVVALAASSLETFKANTRVLLAAMSEIMGDGGLDAEAAKAKSAAADAVSAIADAFGGVFEVVEAALASPFAKVRAGGQRGDTFRTNIKNRIVASLRESVAAIQEALSGLTITIPPGIKDQMQGLADAFSPILDLIERLNGVTVDLKQLRTLALAPAILAAGLIPTGTTTGAGPGGSIIITNTFEPTVSPLPITIHTINNNSITVGDRVIDAIAIEVVNVQEAELRLKP